MLGAGQTASGVREFQRSEFTKEIFIGNGAEGHVYEVEHELNGSMAVKVFARGRAGLDQETLREIENIVKCNHHQNIIRFFGYVVEYFNEKRTITGYAMEHMADGSLHKVIHDPSIAYDSLDLAKWGRQAALALAWLHSQGIIHRDVKPHNMLLSDSRRLLKLCDFGCMRAGAEFSMTLGVGSLLYMAPELLRPLEAGRYSGKCDVYSMGITLWEMSTRKSHFAEESAKATAFSHAHPIDPFISPKDSPTTTEMDDLSRTLTSAKVNEDCPEVSEDAPKLDENVTEVPSRLATQRRKDIQRQPKLGANAKSKEIYRLADKLVGLGRSSSEEVQQQKMHVNQTWQLLQNKLSTSNDVTAAFEVNAFNRDVDETIERIIEKIPAMKSEDFGTDIATVDALLRKQTALERDMGAIHQKLIVHDNDAAAILAKKPPHRNSVLDSLKKLEANWKELGDAAEMRNEKLDKSYKLHKFIDRVCKVEHWAAQVRSKMTSYQQPTTSSAAHQLIELHQERIADIEEKQDEIHALYEEVQRLIAEQPDHKSEVQRAHSRVHNMEHQLLKTWESEKAQLPRILEWLQRSEQST